MLGSMVITGGTLCRTCGSETAPSIFPPILPPCINLQLGEWKYPTSWKIITNMNCMFWNQKNSQSNFTYLSNMTTWSTKMINMRIKSHKYSKKSHFDIFYYYAIFFCMLKTKNMKYIIFKCHFLPHSKEKDYLS